MVTENTTHIKGLIRHMGGLHTKWLIFPRRNNENDIISLHFDSDFTSVCSVASNCK